MHAFGDSSVIGAQSSVDIVVQGIYGILSSTRILCVSRLTIICRTPAIIPVVLRSIVFD